MIVDTSAIVAIVLKEPGFCGHSSQLLVIIKYLITKTLYHIELTAFSYL